MPFLNANLPWLLLAAGILLMIGVLLRRYRRYFAQGRAHPGAETVSALIEKEKHPGHWLDAPTEALRWQVEMQQLARDLKAELDSKSIALQVLIRQAREEQNRLAELLARVEEARPK